MLLILYSQPFRSLFCKVQDLDTQHFQLACPLSQCGDLMWYCNVGEVRIDDLYNLVIVVADALKLEKSLSRATNCVFDGSRLITTASSLKILLTIKRLRLCSNPALLSSSQKRMFYSSLSRKEYL
jgi:hypothetical protein